ncbi:fluoride efflux transporter FluC [Lysobacter soyae]|uniref:Fluoride-specific ion channel FluC n=1 Tax=Lysobacter soyae TaxID=2764185 RepID=A0ABX8WPV9_9GAMM|nr:CrcB family protein [Lysobacter sp. CJ11]QYR52343.1 CrcB family protein [Lysobacter sp. CJ11]
MEASALKMALCVASGGAMGALARYGFAFAAASSLGPQRAFLGTLALNVLGCFVAGLLVVLVAKFFADPALPRAFLIIGLMGGFTTFSAFGLETVQLFQSGDWKTALAYALSSIVLGVLAASAGMALAFKLTTSGD